MNSCAGNRAFTPVGLPHSDICGSRDICSSPQLFAACRVLRRLSVPRHSPCALCNLTFTEPFRVLSVMVLFLRRYPDTDEAFPPKTCSCHTFFCVLFLQVLLLLCFSLSSIFSVFLLSLCSCQGAWPPQGSGLRWELVETTRFELVTSCLQGRRSPN
jgi:hypothetical protein